MGGDAENDRRIRTAPLPDLLILLLLVLSTLCGCACDQRARSPRSRAGVRRRGEPGRRTRHLRDAVRTRRSRARIGGRRAADRRRRARRAGRTGPRARAGRCPGRGDGAHCASRTAKRPRSSCANGRYWITASGALPGGARTPEEALEQLRRVLARRSYAGLMRVLSPATRASIENDLRTLVEGLDAPGTLPVQVAGDSAVVNVPGGPPGEAEARGRGVAGRRLRLSEPSEAPRSPPPGASSIASRDSRDGLEPPRSRTLAAERCAGRRPARPRPSRPAQRVRRRRSASTRGCCSRATRRGPRMRRPPGAGRGSSSSERALRRGCTPPSCAPTIRPSSTRPSSTGAGTPRSRR